MSNNYMTVFTPGTFEDAMRTALTRDDYDFVGIVSTRPNFEKRLEYFCRGLGCKSVEDFMSKTKVEFKMFQFKNLDEVKALADRIPQNFELHRAGVIYVEEYDIAEYLATEFKIQM